MRKVLWMVAMAAVAWSACDDDDNNNDNSPETISGSDLTFVNEATYTNRAEIELGALAVNRSDNAAIMDYGSMMVEQHEDALDDLRAIADDFDADLPNGLDEKHMELKDTLMALSGVAFDSAYIASMADGHAKAITLFEGQASNGNVTRLRDYANKYLPHIREHHHKADSLYQILEDDDVDTN